MSDTLNLEIKNRKRWLDYLEKVVDELQDQGKHLESVKWEKVLAKELSALLEIKYIAE